MTDLVAVHAALVAAAETVEGVRGYSDPAALFDPPAVLISPPKLEWGAYGTGFPTTAKFVAFVIVKVDDRAVENLERLAPLVGAAIWAAEDVDAVVGPAFPGVWRAGTANLPSYEMQIEVSLT